MAEILSEPDQFDSLPPGTHLQCPSPLGTTTHDWWWDGQFLRGGSNPLEPKWVLLKYGPLTVKESSG